MPLGAAAKLRASTANLFQPAEYSALCTVDLPAGSTGVDITGATVTFTTINANAAFTARATFDVDLTGAATTTSTGFLVVDGAVQSAEAHFAAEVSTDRGTCYQQWTGTLATPGSHTIKLRGTTGANVTMRLTHTNLTVTITEVI